LKSFLVIQTSFIGDAILATSILESLHHSFPDANIDLVVRNGNESLFKAHPFIREVFVWDKSSNRYLNLWKLGLKIRKANYHAVFNAHRFASSGFLTWISGAKIKSGFDKNPLSFTYTHNCAHTFNGQHECERNAQLLEPFIAKNGKSKPKLYPSTLDFEVVQPYKASGNYRCMAPTSVWITKQWPKEKWIELCDQVPADEGIYLLGGPNDYSVCEEISKSSQHPNIQVLAGKINLLQSAALMKDAKMNYVNDSAPMHLASSTNAPTTVIYCSTVPSFGFGPLSDNHKVVETSEQLDCRPCGIHGYKACPKEHFKCAQLSISKVI